MRREKSAFGIKTQHRKKGRDFVFFVLSLFFLVLIYRESIHLKQTGPMSKPNSCSAPPMSKGAMSRMGRRDGLFVLYSITVLLHSPVCLCGCEEKKRRHHFRIVESYETKYFAVHLQKYATLGNNKDVTHSAAILQHREGKAAVALSPQLHIVGALEHHGLLQVAALTVHVGNAVPAVVGDVLASMV